MEAFRELAPLVQAVTVYLAAINVIAFFYYALDKMKASWGHRRTPEKVLWLLALIGGSIGSLAAMQLFRHKTKKHSFQAVLVLILLVQIAVVFFVFNETWNT